LFSPADLLTVRMRDGSVLRAEPVRRALGHASRPIGQEELREKFLACGGVAMEAAATERWWDAATADPTAAVTWPAHTPNRSANIAS
jgi:2-methylcitrate dehydratase PrpD